MKNSKIHSCEGHTMLKGHGGLIKICLLALCALITTSCILAQPLPLGIDAVDRASLDIVFLTNANITGEDLRDANLMQVELTGADPSGANPERIKYDQFTLYSISKAKLDGVKMSDYMISDLEKLRGGI